MVTFAHHFYAGSSETLNRLSWKREDADFLNGLLVRPSTRFIAISDLNPLVSPRKSPEPNAKEGVSQLRYLNYDEIKHIVPEKHFVPESHYDGKPPADPNHLHSHDSKAPLVLFLGLEEDSKSADQTLPEESMDLNSVKTPAYFAIDVTPYQKLVASVTAPETKSHFINMRASADLLPPSELSMSGLSRALTDWNRRNKFCAGCGRPTVVVSGGWKRFCCPDEHERGPCISRKGVHNFSFPRTDAVIIVAIIHPNKDKILLGRQKAWPKHFYSTLAGFIEPGESLEEAVRREIWEEAAVRVGTVNYHSTQPWPYPGSLMIGCVAQAMSTESRTDLDNELDDARWFSRPKVLEALGSATGGSLTSKEVNEMQANYGTRESTLNQEEIEALRNSESDNIPLRVPPYTAIANSLISSWARDGYVPK